MLQTKNQKTANLVSLTSFGICAVLQIFFPIFRHVPSISVERDLHTGVIKAGDQTYFSPKILNVATIKIADAGVFSRGFLTDHYLNNTVSLALQSTFVTVVVLLLLKKPIRQTVIFSIIAIIILYGVGCIYTYRWFQINGTALSQSGYELALPFTKDVLLFAFFVSLLYRWARNTRPLTVLE